MFDLATRPLTQPELKRYHRRLALRRPTPALVFGVILIPPAAIWCLSFTIQVLLNTLPSAAASHACLHALFTLMLFGGMVKAIWGFGAASWPQPTSARLLTATVDAGWLVSDGSPLAPRERTILRIAPDTFLLLWKDAWPGGQLPPAVPARVDLTLVGTRRNVEAIDLTHEDSVGPWQTIPSFDPGVEQLWALSEGPVSLAAFPQQIQDLLREV